MSSDNRLVAIIAVALVAALVIPLLMWRHHERNRPSLAEARVVVATDDDPVYREGARRIGPDDRVHLAVALRIDRPGADPVWLAPVQRLEIDGRAVDHLESDRWPEEDRVVRVFWFTVESPFVGGDLTASNAAKRLAYRPFLAPELGSDLHTSGPFEAHNDDSIGGLASDRWQAGTLRFYARAEVVARRTDARVLQAATCLGVEHLSDARFPAVHRGAAFPEPVAARAGELFLLPGFEPRVEPPEDWNSVTVAPLGQTFTTFVDRRLVCSSWTLAAVAAAGTPELDPARLTELGPIVIDDRVSSRQGRPVRWGDDLRPGDLLAAGSHWAVVLVDDGDSRLGADDTVAHCWRRPAAVETLGEAFDEAIDELRHYRYDRGNAPSPPP
jgi:hypothetical protein